MDLDLDLVAEAAGVLGTRRMVDTVHAALEDVVRRRRRTGLLDIDNELTLADLDSIRSHRFAEQGAPYRTRRRR